MNTQKLHSGAFALASLASLFVCPPASARQVSSTGPGSRPFSSSEIGNAYTAIDIDALASWDPSRIFRMLPGSQLRELLTIAGSPGVPTACFSPVPNGGFETGQVPTSISQLANAIPWFDANAASSDYFKVGGGTQAGVPVNLFGTRTPHGGIAYAGIHTYAMSAAVPEYLFREYLEVPLTTPMTMGKFYVVSFWAARADDGVWTVLASNRLGFKLSVGPIFQNNVANLTNPTGQKPGVLTSTDWVRLSWIYIAQGGESYLTIGNFNDNQGTTVQGTATSGVAYYYIDDVSISCYKRGF